MGIVDGLGFEEVNQAVTDTAVISGANVYGSTAVTTALVSATIGSITSLQTTTGNITTISGTAIRAGSVTDIEGRFRSTVIGSATASVYGGVLQVGSVVTAAGSSVFIAFGKPMPSTSYYVVATAHNLAAGDGAGSTVPVVSGTMSTSGVTLIGAASTRYAWMAVG